MTNPVPTCCGADMRLHFADVRSREVRWQCATCREARPFATPAKCARTACDATRHVVCRHTQTGRMYCPSCARHINEYTPDLVAWSEIDPRETICPTA